MINVENITLYENDNISQDNLISILYELNKIEVKIYILKFLHDLSKNDDNHN